MKIALLIGHRKSAQGVRSVKRISEYAYWYTYLHAIVHHFPKKHEYRVFERLDSDGLGYRERMQNVGKRADAWGADLIVSHHFNGSISPKAEGHEVLCSRSSRSKRYAQMMSDSFADAQFGINRGVKVIENDPNVRGSGFLYKTPMPAILVEPFFGTNHEDWMHATRSGNLFRAFEKFYKKLEV